MRNLNPAVPISRRLLERHLFRLFILFDGALLYINTLIGGLGQSSSSTYVDDHSSYYQRSHCSMTLSYHTSVFRSPRTPHLRISPHSRDPRHPRSLLSLELSQLLPPFPLPTPFSAIMPHRLTYRPPTCMSKPSGSSLAPLTIPKFTSAVVYRSNSVGFLLYLPSVIKLREPAVGDADSSPPPPSFWRA